MKQKLQDLMLKLKHQKSAKMVALAVVLCFGWFVVTETMKGGPRVAPAKSDKAPKLDSQRALGNDAYATIVNAYSGRIEKLEETANSTNAKITELGTKMDENVERTAEIFRKLLERVAESEANSAKSGSAGAQPVDVAVADSQGGTAPKLSEPESDELDDFGEEKKQVAPPPKPARRKIATIAAGDSLRVQLLSGVNAPVDGSPYPVVLKAISDVNGPDGSTLPIGEARIVAASQGSLTDSRALFRLTSLNVRFPSGQRKVFNIDGWVVGEDGIRGMQGVLIDPIGKAIGGQMMVGALGALGDGLSAAQLDNRRNADGSSSSFVSGNVGQYAVGQSLKGGADEWRSIVRERIGQLTPQVQVLANRQATAVFAKTVQMSGLFEALSEEETDVADSTSY